MTYSFEEFITKIPFLITGVGYFVLTIAVEIPIVYFSLRKNVSDGNRLLVVTFAANALTTVLVLIMQHAVTSGFFIT